MTTISGMEWIEDPVELERRRLRSALLASLGLHVLVVSALVYAPKPPPFVLPAAIQVDLVAAAPMPQAPKPAAAKPAPEPAPKALPPPPPPPKVKILPKEAPPAVTKPRVEPKPEIKRPPKPKELEYDDALAKLRAELGESAPVVAPPIADAEPSTEPAASSARTGVQVSPELAAWNLAVRRHIRSIWITPPEFRASGLQTILTIQVAADGRVVGEPEVVRSSGNPFYDDNATRAVLKSSPLPAPPAAGRRTIIFTPEE